MSESPQTALVLGGTGRTGSLVAKKLIERGLGARTASRNGSDVLFDWDDPTTHDRALDGVDRVYLVTPVMRVTYADQVAGFLDLAEASRGASRHVPQHLRRRPGATGGRHRGRRGRPRRPRGHHALHPASRMGNAELQRRTRAGNRRGDHGTDRWRRGSLRRRGGHRRGRGRDAARARTPTPARYTRRPARRPSQSAKSPTPSPT